VALSTENIRLVFGLKIKQLRLDKGLSLSDLARLSGMSISYINEIEKGKKYPKADKILALARAMEVEYDELVSLKLSKKLEPISELLDSNILTELPLELFGIDPSTLLELLSGAPTKISAFVGTLIEIARNYNMTVEQFYFSALRTYQEMHDNYFEDIEQEAEKFFKDFNIPESRLADEGYLLDMLKREYRYEIETISLKTYPELAGVRSLTVPKGNSIKLLLNENLNVHQRVFVLGREIGYQYLKLKNRLYSTALVEADSFEQLLNNYKASYFASAIIIKRDLLVNKLKHFFAQEKWKPEMLLEMISFFRTTPETFCYRISNVLPKYFDINQMFFYRFTNFPGENRFDLTKEMHLSKKHNPNMVKEEHYCRRWLALTILNELGYHQPENQGQILCKAQISNYVHSKNEYMIISFAKSAGIGTNQNMSVSMGIPLTLQTRKQIRFSRDLDIARRQVNETCERCELYNCSERMAAPVVIQKKLKAETIRTTITQILKDKG